MHLPRLPHPVRDILWFTVIGALVGAAYGHMIAVTVDGHPFFGLVGLPRGILTGVLITGILFSFERGLAVPAIAWLSKTPFLAVRFVDDINHMLGQNVLLDFVTGRYYRPRLEQRIFLFIDIEGSMALAERLGELAFHRLVNRFVVDVTAPIRRSPRRDPSLCRRSGNRKLETSSWHSRRALRTRLLCRTRQIGTAAPGLSARLRRPRELPGRTALWPRGDRRNGLGQERKSPFSATRSTRLRASKSSAGRPATASWPRRLWSISSSCRRGSPSVRSASFA
jgi:hypothetical protein